LGYQTIIKDKSSPFHLANSKSENAAPSAAHAQENKSFRFAAFFSQTAKGMGPSDALPVCFSSSVANKSLSLFSVFSVFISVLQA